MKLPGGDHAVVEIVKLRDYCLSADHPRGRHKARVFQALLGLSAADAEYLRTELLEAAVEAEAVPGETDAYGLRYIIDFDLTFRSRTAKIRSAWIVLEGETVPRLTTCYVLLD